ncbi:hypothetical protein [Anaerofustis sp.]|jgi:hypothetical protein|uniref:hypothetical protein n=1 Tax=Anaerofustis sp. TaxID=1872517 RepID=UPI0025C6E2A8|nr:hypothetical protein [Anaerofustis sp.]
MKNNALEVFDILALFSITTSLYNMSLNEGHAEEQERNEARLERIEEKIDRLLNKNEVS